MSERSPGDRRRRPEILAPAGSFTSLSAALTSGADAVYFGVHGFNMRAGARNFAVTDLPEVVARCREAGARAYLALNILIYEHELPALARVLDAGQRAGVDAVICWDLATIQGCRERDMEVHLSTQASVSNSQGILSYYRGHGIRRFVLAREVSLEGLMAIRAALGAALGDEAELIELEVFAHGAMCVSVSGRCFLSESVTGRSANRGDCLQPCRREYRISSVVGEHEYVLGTDYVLSPGDLCVLPFLETLLAAGVHSLKIEGRSRGAEYVATVTSVYRRAVDYLFDHADDPYQIEGFEELRTDLLGELKAVFNRGLSPGFYMGKPAAGWQRSPKSQATARKAAVGVVSNWFRVPGVALITVQSVSFDAGARLLIQGPTTGSVSFTASPILLDGQELPRAEQGMQVTVAVPERVRAGDKVFVQQPRRAPQSRGNT